MSGVYAGADTVEPKLDLVLGGSLLCDCADALLFPAFHLPIGCCHLVALAGSARVLVVDVGVVVRVPRLGLRPPLCCAPGGVNENPLPLLWLPLTLPVLLFPRGALVLRRRRRPRSVCSTSGDGGGSGAPKVTSIGGGMEAAPSRPDRPKVPVGVRARGRELRSSFEFNSCATTGF